MIHVCVGEWSSKEKGTTLILVRRLMNEWNRIKKLTYGILMLNNNVDKIALKGKYKSWITSQITILLIKTLTGGHMCLQKENPFEQNLAPLAKERGEYREGRVFIQHK